MTKEHGIWKPIGLTEEWLDVDTGIIDGVTDAWFARRVELQENSKEFAAFMEQLKREHAIETGVIERLYDLDRGVTETLIKRGIVDAHVSHTDTNVPVEKLKSHLIDHMAAVEYVFDVVKEDRELTIGFIHDLHTLVTRNQDTTEGRDQFGNKTVLPLRKGAFKELDNNPTRADGVKYLYCPPIHVSSEMANLIAAYDKAVNEEVHPVVITAWLHHAFTTIHPYQDGNGRVGRLLASLILIKNGLFPFTVRRQDAKEIYIDSLEKADAGNPQPLVNYICETQREHISSALNLKQEPQASSLDEVAKIFSGKLEEWQSAQRKEREAAVSEVREKVFEMSLDILEKTVERLKVKFNGNTEFNINSCSPTNDSIQHYYQGQIIKYAKRHNYYYNRHLSKGWITLSIGLNRVKWYRLGITVHHQGSDDRTLVIGAFLEDTTNDKVDNDERIDTTLPLEIRPVLISTENDPSSKETVIKKFIEHALTVTLGHIASEL